MAELLDDTYAPADLSSDSEFEGSESESETEMIQNTTTTCSKNQNIFGTKRKKCRNQIKTDEGVDTENTEKVISQRKRQKLADLKQMCKTKNAARRNPAADIITFDAKTTAAYFSKVIATQSRVSRLSASLCSAIIPPAQFVDLQGKPRGKDKMHSVITAKGCVPYAGKWKWKPEKKHKVGSPIVLVVCSDAIRACEVLRSLKPHFKCQKGKLFAKHIKLEDHVKQCKASPMPIAVGTPNRIGSLASLNALKLDKLKLVIVDMHKGAKGYNVMDMHSVRTDFVKLYNNHFHVNVLTKKLKIALY